MVLRAWLRASAVASVSAGLLLCSTLGRAAEPSGLALDWYAPTGCPDRDSVRARVAELVGGRGRSADSVRLDARAVVTLLQAGSFRAELDVVHGGTTRTRILEAPTCGEVAEASAVVLALAISPESDAGAAAIPMPQLAAPEPTNEPAVAARSTARVDDRQPTATARAGAATPRYVAGFGLAVDFALASAAAPGATLAGSLMYGRFGVGLRGSFFPERSSSLQDQPTQGVNISLLAFAPLVCVAPFTLPVELAACAEFELGRLHASGYGPPEHYDKVSSWLAPGGGLGAAFPRRGRVRARFGLDVLVPLGHTQFVLTNVGIPHRLPVVDARPALAIEVVLP